MSLQRRVARSVKSGAIDRLNQLLGQELGFTVNNDPKYAWFWSEDLMRPKRIYAKTDGEYQLSYVRTERRVLCHDGLPGLVGRTYQKTISIMEPYYEVQKLLPNVQHSFVLCIWIEGQTFQEWRKQFDDTMEWPKGGEYFPVSAPGHTAYLVQGQIPTRDQTWQVIRWVREDKDKALTYLQALDTYLDNDKKRIKFEQNRAMHTLDDLLPAWDNIPGRRSGPIEFWAETKPDPRIGGAELDRMFGQAADLTKPASSKIRADRSVVTV